MIEPIVSATAAGFSIQTPHVLVHIKWSADAIPESTIRLSLHQEEKFAAWSVFATLVPECC